MQASVRGNLGSVAVRSQDCGPLLREPCQLLGICIEAPNELGLLMPAQACTGLEHIHAVGRKEADICVRCRKVERQPHMLEYSFWAIPISKPQPNRSLATTWHAADAALCTLPKRTYGYAIRQALTNDPTSLSRCTSRTLSHGRSSV